MSNSEFSPWQVDQMLNQNQLHEVMSFQFIADKTVRITDPIAMCAGERMVGSRRMGQSKR